MIVSYNQFTKLLDHPNHKGQKSNEVWLGNNESMMSGLIIRIASCSVHIFNKHLRIRMEKTNKRLKEKKKKREESINNSLDRRSRAL